MKGQSFVLTHAMFVGFSIFFVLVIVMMFSSLKDDYQDFIAKNEMNQVCLSIKSSVEKIYLLSSYSIATNTTVGKIRIVLPDRIADMTYRINFSGNSAFIQTTKLNESCVIGFSGLTGYTSGGATDVVFAIYSNSTKIIEMIKI